jgi:TATA-binding protein-associated factor Taf7
MELVLLEQEELVNHIKEEQETQLVTQIFLELQIQILQVVTLNLVQDMVVIVDLVLIIMMNQKNNDRKAFQIVN